MMGFMDKAKKLAEQAQQKLDEAQENFNKGGSTPGQPGAGSGARYDEHGRPIQEEAAAPDSAAAPAPDPAAPPARDPAAPEPAAAPAADSAASTPPPPPAEGEANATPDPFKPLQQ
jgi:hypothetical protein